MKAATAFPLIYGVTFNMIVATTQMRIPFNVLVTQDATLKEISVNGEN